MNKKIKLHYPVATVVEATLRGHLPPKPGDIVLVFDPNAISMTTFTILVSIDGGNEHGKPFIAPVMTEPDYVYHWTYAYKVPEGYAHVETSND